MNNNPEYLRQQFDTTQQSSASGFKNGQRTFDTSPSLLRMFQGNPSQQISTQIRSFDYSAALGNTTGYLKNQGLNQSPRLMDALNQVLNTQNQNQRSALELLEAEEKCQFHQKEQHIAVDDETGTFACNKCVFEKKIQKPLFMATFARQTKKRFDEMYEKLLLNITSVEDLTPSLISQRIQSQIQDFFSAIYLQMKEIERDVLNQVKSSTKLKELAYMIETLNAQFDEELLHRLEVERNVLNDKVDRARFGYIVSRKQYYKDLIKEMEGFNIQLSSKIETSGQLLTDLIAVKIDRLQIYDRLYDLVEHQVMINNENIERKAPPPAQELNLMSLNGRKNDDFISPFKTPQDRKMNGRVEENKSQGSSQNSDNENLQSINTFYTLRDNDILRTSLSTNLTDKLFTVNHCFSPRVAFTQKGKVFLIGGSKDQGQNQLINNTFELVFGKTGRSTRRRSSQNHQQEPWLVEKSSMNLARIAFGCAVDNYGEKIFAIGGTVGQQQPTNQGECYDVASNTWMQLPSLNEAKFSHSLCIFNDTQLFSFGGFDQSHKLSSKIERIHLDGMEPRWEIINVQLPRPVSSAGGFQIVDSEIVIFGGWDQQNLISCFILKNETPSTFSIQEEDECHLAQPDLFLFTGAFRMDLDKREIIVSGQDYIHKFNEKERGFEIIKKIE